MYLCTVNKPQLIYIIREVREFGINKVCTLNKPKQYCYLTFEEPSFTPRLSTEIQ